MRRLAGFGALGWLIAIAGCDVSSGGGNTGGSSGSTGAGGSTGSGGSTGHTNPLGQDVIDAFVTAHNQARSGPLNPPPSPALPPVSWDAVLADSVYNYARTYDPKRIGRTDDGPARGTPVHVRIRNGGSR